MKMAKILKKDGSLVVKKSGWSVFSIWWTLVLGIILPAVFVVMSFDINSYKKNVWDYVNTTKTTTIAELNADLAKDIQVLNDKNTTKTNEISEYEKSIKEAEAVIEANDASVKEIQAKIPAYAYEMDEKEESIATKEAEIAALEAEIAALEAEIVALNDTKTPINEALKNETDDTVRAELEAQLADIEAQVAPLQASKNEKLEAVKALNEEITTLKGEIKAMEDEIASIDTLMAEMQAKEDAIQADKVSIANCQGVIANNEATIENWNATYGKEIKDLEAALEELIKSEDAIKYDNMTSRVYNVADGKTFNFGYTGNNSTFGLAAGILKSMFNKDADLVVYENIAITCLIIGIVIFAFVALVQLIRVIIAKKTAWTFYDGAVVYKKGRIFSAEETTRDMEFFPGMTVSIRRTLRGKLLSYGDVIVSNGAGEAGEIVMLAVKKPKKVQKLLRNMIAMACTRTANMMSPYKMYPQMYRHVLGGYPAYYYGAMQSQQQQPKK
jgi:peptidoglycan hydrolase CwlO-like protein